MRVAAYCLRRVRTTGEWAPCRSAAAGRMLPRMSTAWVIRPWSSRFLTSSTAAATSGPVEGGDDGGGGTRGVAAEVQAPGGREVRGVLEVARGGTAAGVRGP